MVKVKTLLFFCLYIITNLYSMKIEPLQFEDLMGEFSPVWYNLTDSDQEKLVCIKNLFMKNNEIIPQSHSKIPNVLHWIWLGPKPFPKHSKKNILSWQALHPEWKMKFWTDNPQKKPPISGMEVCSIKDLPDSPISHLIQKAGNYGEQSDIVRYIILLSEGGVYVDHDIFAVLPFDTLNRQYDFYCYLETPLDFSLQLSDSSNIRLNNGLLGAKPGHVIFEKIMKYVSSVWDDLQSRYPNNDPNSQLIRTMERTFLMFTKGVIDAIDQPGYCDIIFPSSFGCPRFGFNNFWVIKKLKERSLIYAQHFHDSLWLHSSIQPKKKKNRKRLFLLVSHVVLTAPLCFFIFYTKRHFVFKRKRLSKLL